MKAEDYFESNMLSGVEVPVKDQILMSIHPTRRTARIDHLSRVSCEILLVPDAAGCGKSEQRAALLQYPFVSPKTYRSFSSHLDMKLWMLVSPRLRPSSGQVILCELWSAHSTRLRIRRRANASFETATNGAAPSSGCGRNGGHTCLSHSGCDASLDLSPLHGLVGVLTPQPRLSVSRTPSMWPSS